MTNSDLDAAAQCHAARLEEVDRLELAVRRLHAAIPSEDAPDYSRRLSYWCDADRRHASYLVRVRESRDDLRKAAGQ